MTHTARDRHEFLVAYQTLIGDRYPTVLLRIAEIDDPEDASPLFDAFCVPDGRQGEFVQFVLEDLSLEAEQRGLPGAAFIPHGTTATRRYYPGAYEECAFRFVEGRVLPDPVRFEAPGLGWSTALADGPAHPLHGGGWSRAA